MIYRARYVLPMDGSVIENGEVMVSDGIIVAVGIDIAGSHPEESVRDLGNAVLMPGFVNAHSHLEYTHARNQFDALNLWDWIDKLGFGPGRKPGQDLLIASAMLGAVECALSGITCLGDSSPSGAAADAIDTIGLRGIVYLEVYGQSSGDNYAQEFQRKLDYKQELQAAHSELVSFGISPHAIYTSNAGLLKLCAEACAETNLPIALHLAETQAEVEYSLHGTGPIAEWRHRLGYAPMNSGLTPAEYIHQLGLLQKGVCLAHCVHLSKEEVALIGGSGVGVAHCPRSNAYLGAGIAPICELVNAGADVGLGTDSAGSCLRLDFFEEMRCAMGISRASQQDAAAIKANHVLKLATIGGARAIGLSDVIGTLELGKRADMVAIDMSDAMPGEDVWLSVLSRSSSDVLLTIVNGVVIAERGSLTKVDLVECKARLRECLEQLGCG